MRCGSICSGIEAASVAWRPLGWRTAFLSEIEPFPRAVLAHRYPEVPLHGDFTTIEAGQYEPIDLLVGGTPCQSFSVAGKRLGLDDPRGNLAVEYLGLARRLKPRWLVFENVPGLLSSDGGRDFGAFLGLLGQCGYGWAYRVLDAQFVRVDGFARAVPQRRRRVFVVGYLGDWRPPAAVLLEPESLRGDPAPGREAGERVAGPVTACAGTERKHGHGWGQQEYESGFAVAHALRADGLDASEGGTGRGTPLVAHSIGLGSDPLFGDSVAQPVTGRNGDPGVVAFSCKDHGADADGAVSPTLRAMGHDGSHANAGGQVAVAFNITPSNSNKDYNAREASYAQAVTASSGAPSARGGDVVTASLAVRRLTPRECERLQGLPDDWTLVPYRGKPAKDGPRYKAIGNSMAVNVMRWIGRRIEAFETAMQARAA